MNTPPSMACAFKALSGPKWMSPQAGGKAPISSITTSNGPSRSRIDRYSVVNRVSPLKNTKCFGERIANDDQSVALRSFNPRPEKCCDGAAVNTTPVLGTVYDSHQSSSVIRSVGTPQYSRCAPTPSDVTNGTAVLAKARMVG